jgi:hypothetical protein
MSSDAHVATRMRPHRRLVRTSNPARWSETRRSDPRRKSPTTPERRKPQDRRSPRSPRGSAAAAANGARPARRHRRRTHNESRWRIGRSFLSASTRTRARGRWASRRPRDHRAGGSRQPVARRQVMVARFMPNTWHQLRQVPRKRDCGSNGQTACSLSHASQAAHEGCWPRGRGEWRPLQDAVDARGGSHTVKWPQRCEVTRY